MKKMMKNVFILWLTSISSIAFSQNNFWQNKDSSLKGTSLMVEKKDMSSLMLEGINNYFDKQSAASADKRAEYWHADFSDVAAYEKSVLPNRRRLAEMIGIQDPLVAGTKMEYISTTSMPAKVAENEHFTAYAVRWRLFGDVYGEGLLLQPRDGIKARIIAIPDADQTPESLIGTAAGLSSEMQYARHLAENGCQVIIPAIIDRSDSGSGSARLGRYTNQPHREWIYRQAYTFGRHVIGYEVQKILAAVDWFGQENKQLRVPIGVVGWGEGGLLGFYSAAVDTRIDAALISGYFGKREALWKEPIYRNIFGLLGEFGDAEIAGLIVPRRLVIEYAPVPPVKGPPPPRPGGNSRLTASAAPGSIITAPFEEVDAEVKRAKQLAGKFSSGIQFIHDDGKTVSPGSAKSLKVFLEQLQPGIKGMVTQASVPAELRTNFDAEERQLRQVFQLEQYTQSLIANSRYVRDTFFWNKAPVTRPEVWRDSMKYYQKYFWDNVIGRIPPGKLPLNPHSRKIFDEATWTGYEVTLDVLPGVIVWGYLLLPKDIKPGEKRPVMVVHHGGSGLPKDVMDKDSKYYKGMAVQLAERGFIVFAPHFPWREGDEYRKIQRKANPLGLSVFSIILNQHERLLDWLSEQPWVDSHRIGLYGLSWGGKVAIRIPALLDRYSLTIASGDFNEWIWKNATTDWQNSYMFVPEYEMFDFGLARTFNYGEMAALIAPRAFMVERGHDDAVGIDEWVAFEYAKVKRLYDKLKIPQLTRIEYFNGGHEMNGQGTFEFIQQHFNWPLKK